MARPEATADARAPGDTGPLVTMGAVAGALTAADLLTKQIAVSQLGVGGDVPLGAALRLALFYNDGMGGGVAVAGGAFRLTMVATLGLLAAAAAVCRPLAAVDRAAPRMLGLIAGAALGNALSLVLYTAGAPDFIAVDRGGGAEAVFNVADVALVAGLALCARTAWRITLAVRDERARTTPAPARAEGTATLRPVAMPVTAPARFEREVPLAVARERGTTRGDGRAPGGGAPVHDLPDGDARA